MILGNIDKHKGHGLVAFIDILGFSKEILEHWGENENNPLEKLLLLKENLPYYSKEELTKEESNDSNSKTWQRRIYPCRVQTISDSVIVSIGFDDKPKYVDVLLSLLAFFHTISDIWRNALETGFTIRGAADWGEIFWNDKEIIGPSFIKTYSLEQNQAKSSRVILSSSLNKNLEKLFSETQTRWNDEILQMLKKDSDGYLILNPHSLYNSKDKSDKVILIERLEDLQSKANYLNKEKYNPILTILNTDDFSLSKDDLGKY